MTHKWRVSYGKWFLTVYTHTIRPQFDGNWLTSIVYVLKIGLTPGDRRLLNAKLVNR